MKAKQKKFLITGGAGFIGSNVVKRLLELGEFVRVVDNFSTGREENIKEFLNHKNFEFIKGDLTDFKICQEIVKDIDYILHCAAIPSVYRSVEKPIEVNRANVVATLNLLVAARDEGNIKKFVYSSSSSIYGNSPKLPKNENDPVNPISPYALSKYTGERYCQIFSRIYNLPTICLRYFNVYGPKQDPVSQYGAAIPHFIFAMLRGKPPVVYGDGEQTRDFTYIDNIVEANILAARSDISDKVINIACGQRVSLNEIIKLANKYLKSEIKPVYQAVRPGDIKHSLADISEAKKLLNYKPKVYFEEGLKKTIDWFKELGIFEITEHFSSIRLASEKDVEEIAELYHKEIKTGFVSSLGVPFLTKLYKAIIKSKDAFCIVAEIDKQINGFIAGAVNINKFYWHFSKKYFLKAGLSFFSKVLKPHNIKKIFETLFYPRKRIDLPKAELITIVVKKEFQNQGLEEALFKNFVREMKKRGARSFKSTISETFKSTIEFYEKMGLKFHRSVEIHKGHPSRVYVYDF